MTQQIAKHMSAKTKYNNCTGPLSVNQLMSLDEKSVNCGEGLSMFGIEMIVWLKC